MWQQTKKVLGNGSLGIINPVWFCSLLLLTSTLLFMLITNEKHNIQTGTVLENVFGQCYPMHDSGLPIQLGCRGSCEHPMGSFKVFPYWGIGGVSPLVESLLIPLLRKNHPSITPANSSFLAAVIAPIPFLF